MDALEEWYGQILSYIQENDLKNLSEFETEDGYKPFEKFTDVTRAKEPITPFSYSDFKHGDEFNFLSMDLIYIIAYIELLHPFINNAVREGGTYSQTMEDHLYLRYSGFGLQVIYSYWDRIGDILALFFKTGLKGDVYLAKVFNNFPREFRSDTYMELLILYKTEIENVLTFRHDVVHSFGLKGKYYWGVISEDSLIERKKLQMKKITTPSYSENSLNTFFQGLL